MPHVIAIVGPIGSGKTTVAKILREEHGFISIKFADILKNMLRTLYRSVGLPEPDIERKIEGDLKECACPILLGKSPRWAMQSLGTEWGRDLIHQDLWAHIGVQRARYGNAPRVVFEDCRFLNEATMLRRELDAHIWRIEGRGQRAAHVSEQEHYAIEANIEIANTGNLDYLKQQVATALTICPAPAQVYGVL